jgi:hypothetical protein
MSKPTLVQTLLNRPSQTYSTPSQQQRKEYHSAKQEMLRIAAAQVGMSFVRIFGQIC